MELGEADKLFATPARVASVDGALADKKARRIRIEGLEGSAVAMLLAGLKKSKVASLVVADDMDTAGYMYHDLCQILGPEKIGIFPSGYKRAIKYGQPDPPSQILRTEVLDALREKNCPLQYVVTYPEALAEKVADAETRATNTVSLKKGQRIILSDLLGRLRELGFKETEYVY